jgi:Ser/Thr protein kinase RdoA (MazF antagonist)
MKPLDPAALELCAAAYGLRAGELSFISASQNHVYRAERDGARSILRITHDRCHTLPEVQGELRWVTWLRDEASCDDFVCAPYPSPQGALVETVIHEGETFLVTRFQHAAGRPLEEQDLTPELFHLMGRRLGRLHRHTIGYVEDPKQPRRHWFQSRLLNEDLERHLPPGREAFKEAVRALIAELRKLPVIPTSYGMVHGDFYYGNCYTDEGRLRLFDFDNCEHAYFLHDLATAYYDCVFNRLTRRQRAEDLPGFSRDFWEHFLAGYTEQALELDRTALRKFLILREAVIYVHYHRIYDMSTRPKEVQEGVDQMRRNVEERTCAIPWLNG